jgi:adenylosuccinate lyase
VGARVTESTLYGHLWGTDELRAVFDERARLQSWLDILAALAGAQAELDIVPAAAAAAIADGADVERLDLAFVAEETRRTGHSTLGLIHGLRRTLAAEASEWVYYGVTVQDVTDTWTALAMRAVGALAWRDLRALEASLLELAERHRDTVMVGRTHGQQGAPITFGFKAAGWADEIRRHLDRLREGRPRWLVGQLGGAVGTLGFFGEHGPELRRRFCDRLELHDPGIAWTASRDRVVEFASVLTMASATTARIGNEVYQLQRPEIGELREPSPAETVASITMPHKRNPEVSEHLVTLSRLTRAHAAVLAEGAVTEHERDGRGWKAEWVAFPEVCLLAGTALRLCRGMVDGLEVDAEAMRANLGGYAASEAVLAALAPAVGKHRAQELLQDVLAEARAAGRAIDDALVTSPALQAHVGADVLAAAADPHPGSAPLDTDRIVARIREVRASEGDAWS